MARPLKPLVKSGGYYPSSKWTPLVYAGGRTTMADGGGDEPIDPLNTFSGAIASFKCAEARPLVDLTVAIEPVQSGSGDPSPDNVRPISGWTGVNIHVSPTTDAQDGTTYSITFPSAAGTVYGGTLDVTTGVLTVDMAMIAVGGMNWTMYNVQQGNLFRSPVIVNANLPYDDINVVCSHYRTSKASQRANGTLSVGSVNRVDIIDNNYSTADAFKAAMSAARLVYPIATSAVYDLTPTEVTTLIGNNNVWADTGDVTVQAYAIAM